MRQHRVSRCADEARIEPDINGAYDGRDIGRALGEPVQDRGLAGVAMLDVGRDEVGRIADFAAMAGQVDRLGAVRELCREFMKSLIAPSGGATIEVDHAIT